MHQLERYRHWSLLERVRSNSQIDRRGDNLDVCIVKIT
jgi:hypothetical protein